MRMPTEFQDYITVCLCLVCQSDRRHRPFPVAHVAAADVGLQQPAPQRSGEHSQVAQPHQHPVPSPFLSRSFADAIRSNAFLFTAHKEKMTGIGWICLVTDWSTMRTYAYLSKEFRQPVMEGMVIVSPFVGAWIPLWRRSV